MIRDASCRSLKAQAQRSLLVVKDSPGCFLPTHGDWGPVQPQTRVPLFAARTLKATGQLRVIISLQ